MGRVRSKDQAFSFDPVEFKLTVRYPGRDVREDKLHDWMEGVDR